MKRWMTSIVTDRPLDDGLAWVENGGDDVAREIYKLRPTARPELRRDVTGAPVLKEGKRRVGGLATAGRGEISSIV